MSTLHLFKNMSIKTKSTKALNNPTINLNSWLQNHPEFYKKFNKNKEISFLKKNLVWFVVAGVVLGILLGIVIGLFVNL